MIRVEPDNKSGTERDCYWSIGRSRVNATRVGLPPGAEFLWLNPAMTSANVVLGVAGPGLPSTHMRPGDVVPLHKGTRAVQIWNPYRRHYTSMSTENVAALVGHVGLFVLDSREVMAAIASPKDHAPPSSVLLAVSSKGGTWYVPTANLKGVRVSVAPLNVAEDSIAATPVDFAATVKVGASIPVTSLSGLTAAGTFGDPIDLPDQDGDRMGALFQAPNDALTAAAAYGTTTFDFPVVAGATFATVWVGAIAGTGISTARAALIVEGR